MIKAILIDLDDTILDFEACCKEAIEAASLELNVTLHPDFYPTFFKITFELWQKMEENKLTVKQVLDTRFQLVFDTLGMPYDGLEFERHFSPHLAHTHSLIDGAFELVKYLSNKFKLYAASNSNLEQQKKRLALAGLKDYFDGFFIASEIGYAKPSKEYFDECMKRLNLPTREVLLIGDSLCTDIEGANKYGLKSIWFNPKRMADLNHVHDYEANSLWDIMKMI